MKNTFGQSVTVTLFGESHGAMIGAVIDGLAPGLRIDEDFIRHQLSLRRPQGRISTSRAEADEFSIVSGVFEGKTTGTPVCILIPNTNTRSGDYTPNIPRPGHADFTAQCKYNGNQDYRGGGHFSGRVTAALVAAGAIAISALRQNGILIGTHISRLANISDRSFDSYESDIETLADLTFPVLDSSSAAVMRAEIENAAAEGDSVGGVLETAVIGEIYAAREQNVMGISSSDLCRNIPDSVYCSTLDKVTDQLRQLAQPGDLILTVGAGDIYRAGEKLLEN